MSSLGDATLARFAGDEAHYRALVQASGQISWTMPPDGLATGEQRAWCAYTGQGSKEIVGLGWLDAVHPDERAGVKAAWLAAVAARVMYEAVVRIRRADGVYRTCLLRGLPLLKEHGVVREWLGFCTDMTVLQDAQAERERRLVEMERARAVSESQQTEERLLHERGEAQASELELREANQIMDEFLGIVSHELRTPLATILANVQIAGRRVERLQAGVEQRVGKDDALVAQAAAVQGLLTRAETAALRQNRLVSDLLDVSRIQSGRLEIVPERIELGQLVRRCVEEERLAHSGRSIALELPEEEVPVLGDADRIGQVITNYLSNALKYSGEEKRVMVLLRLDGQRARVAVRDEGPGVPPEEQGHIWERFYRSPGAERQAGSGVGLGLGLHISKTIVERHGGQVGVESVPGAGATFWFTLPLLAPETSDTSDTSDAPDTGV